MQGQLFNPHDREVFSPCGVYRYELVREIGEGPPALFCGLNPSIAGKKVTRDNNDPTIRKDIGFARRWGCGSIVKVNAYGYVETESTTMVRAMKAGVDVVGPENDECVRRAVERVVAAGGTIVVCWGAKISPARQAEISYVFGDHAMCLGTNKDGTPEHPLYIPYERQLVHWSCP